MNHVAILSEEKWPRGIFVNWWVTGEGNKISKSKGGAVPIPNAIEKYGVDAMRLYYAHIGSPHVDVVWTEDVVVNYKNALERVYSLVEQLSKLSGGKKTVDDWLESRLNKNLQTINESMKEYQLRELASVVYFNIYDDLKWYLRRGGENKKLMEEVINIWCILMNPITPHLSEEINELIKSKSLVSVGEWPKANPEKINFKSEAGEELVKNTVDGMRHVLKLAKVEKARKYTLFIAESWLYELFNLISKEIQVTRNIGEIMRRVLEVESMKMKGTEVSKIVASLLKDVSKIPTLVTSQEEELKAMQEAKEYLEKEFDSKIEIVVGEESSNPKAKSAMPGKVGILVE